MTAAARTRYSALAVVDWRSSASCHIGIFYDCSGTQRIASTGALFGRKYRVLGGENKILKEAVSEELIAQIV